MVVLPFPAAVAVTMLLDPETVATDGSVLVHMNPSVIEFPRASWAVAV